MHTKVEQRLRYNMKSWQKNYYFYILNNISEYFTLVHLIDSLVHVNDAIIIVGYWIFDSNYEKLLYLTQGSLDLICSAYIGEEQVVKFQSVFYSVR